jgi:Domain of unknown function (DUF4249)
MLKVGPKSIITLIAVFTLCTCIDPFSPKLNGYESLLVVEGLITDADSSNTVRLSRTFRDQNSIPFGVSDATVSVTDDAGNSSYLINMGGGIYKTDSLVFKGMIGRTYTMHIVTQEGNEYESVPCLMQSVSDIDSIYFAKDQELINNGTESQEGIRIYLDSKTGDYNQYYRWSFEETWKFKLPSPKRYDYIDKNTIVPVANIKLFCWKNKKSDEVLIRSVYSGQTGSIKKEPMFFIATDKSDRLMIEYSILVKQYSISKSEYDFWDKLKRVNESGADIFASQPFLVVSNIHNINNQNEKVLGYFQVSAAKQKRIFIPFKEIVRLHLPFFHYDMCKRVEDGPEVSGMTFDKIYETYCINSDYYFIEPMYNSETGKLEKLVFARPECVNCQLTGTLTKPDFWVDLP